MVERTGVVLVLGLAFAASGTASLPFPDPGDCAPPVVRKVSEGSTVEAAGLRPGDVLTGWSRPTASSPDDAGFPTSGPICSVFDYWWFGLEVVGRSPASVLEGRRDGRPISWRDPSQAWSGLTVEPPFPESLAEAWEQARPRRGELGEAADRAWAALLEGTEEELPVPDRSWLLLERGFGLAQQGDLERGDASMERAGTLARGRHPWIEAHSRWIRAKRWAGTDPDRAVALLKEAEELWSAEGDELSAAEARYELGNLHSRQGDPEVARRDFQSVVDVRRQLAPASRSHATALHNLAISQYQTGQTQAALQTLEEAREYLERYPADSVRVSAASILGFLYGMVGDVEGQMQSAEEAVELVEELELPADRRVGPLVNLVGAVAGAGDLARAELLIEEAIRLADETKDPEVQGWARQSQAYIAEEQGDLEGAVRSYRRAVELYRAADGKEEDQILAVASLATALGNVGRWEEAERAFEEAAERLQGHGGTNPVAIPLLAGWSDFLLERGRPEQALARAEEALAAADEGGIGGGHYRLVASLARGRALVALDRSAEAAEQADRALVLARRFGPGARAEIQALSLSGAVDLGRGRAADAVDAYCRGVELVEGQVERLGRALDHDIRFRSRSHDLFDGCADALVALGRVPEAFEILERSRAWETRRMLAERNLVTPGTVGGVLGVRFRRLAAEHDGLLAELAAGPEDQVEAVRERLRELDREREELISEVRRSNPRLAEAAYPVPLAGDETTKRLRPDEVLLAFDVGAERTLAFRLDREGVTVRRLEAGTADWTLRIDDLYRAIERQERERFEAISRSLWSDLVDGDLPRNGRLFVYAEGPLEGLPWSAMGRADEAGRWRWLIEDVAPTVIPSATVLDQLRAREPSTGRRVVAFADPGRGAPVEADSLRSALALVGPLPELPGTRQEVSTMAEVLSEWGDVALYLGEEASETNARSVGRGDRIVHFAGHALVDEQNPLESGLVLASPEAPEPGLDNGFLQAWEIVSSLRLEADLVTLSACSTVRGQSRRGEGMGGLSRAFLHAGARSVLASLWPVSDRGTADLMEAFYREVARGAPRDEALRRAQLGMVRSGKPGSEPGPRRGVGGLAPEPTSTDRSDPFYWAAFRLVGAPD